MGSIRIHVHITGKVQGVYFRKSTQTEAEKNTVYGWVKNLNDGRVEAVMEGEEENVNQTLEWCRKGPDGSKVDDITVQNETYTGKYDSFEIRY